MWGFVLVIVCPIATHFGRRMQPLFPLRAVAKCCNFNLQLEGNCFSKSLTNALSIIRCTTEESCVRSLHYETPIRYLSVIIVKLFYAELLSLFYIQKSLIPWPLTPKNWTIHNIDGIWSMLEKSSVLALLELVFLLDV